MKRRQLACFCEIAKTKSFTQAAKNLYIAQPGVSYNISALEKELGVPLFMRDFDSKNKSVLSEYGEMLYEPLSRALALFEEAENAVKIARENENNRMTMCLTNNLIPWIAYQMREMITSKIPDIMLNVITRGSLNRIKEDVQSGTIDVAVVPERIDAENIECEQIFRTALYAYVPKTYPYSDGDKVSVAKLSEYPLLETAADVVGLLNHMVLSMEDEAGIKLSRSYVKKKLMSERLLYVSLGQGYTIGANFPYDEKLISRLELVDEKAYLPYYMIWKSSRTTSHELRRLIKVIRGLYKADEIVE